MSGFTEAEDDTVKTKQAKKTKHEKIMKAVDDDENNLEIVPEPSKCY